MTFRMLRVRGVVLLACCATLAAAALPPGYEEELYCPPGACLVKKEVRCAPRLDGTRTPRCCAAGARVTHPRAC